MSEIYRKRGSVTRWENGTLVHVAESGVAVEDGELFECWPEESRLHDPLIRRSATFSPAVAGEKALVVGAPHSTSSPFSPAIAGEKVPKADEGVVTAIAASIASLIHPPLRIERLIVSEGTAQHEFDGRTWTDETRRVHLSIVRDRIRALVDLGSFELTDITTIANAMMRFDGERDAPSRLRLAPNVAAALLPSLVGLVPPNVELRQSAGGLDGKGLPIEDAVASPWPNWYRPTYRARPIRVPLNLKLHCAVEAVDEGVPRAVALLAPLDGLTMRVLIEDGLTSYASRVNVTRIDAVSHQSLWYPYGGGSFGAEMML